MDNEEGTGWMVDGWMDDVGDGCGEAEDVGHWTDRNWKRKCWGVDAGCKMAVHPSDYLLWSPLLRGCGGGMYGVDVAGTLIMAIIIASFVNRSRGFFRLLVCWFFWWSLELLMLYFFPWTLEVWIF